MTAAQGQDEGQVSEAARGQDLSRLLCGDCADAADPESGRLLKCCAPECLVGLDQHLCLLTESLLASAALCAPQTKSYPTGSAETGLRPKVLGLRTTGPSDLAFVNLWPRSTTAMTQNNTAPRLAWFCFL